MSFLDSIRSSIDVEATNASHAVMLGGVFKLGEDLARSGVRKFTLIDYDSVEGRNMSRHDFYRHEIGHSKVHAVARRLGEINPEIEVDVLVRDFCELSANEIVNYLVIAQNSPKRRVPKVLHQPGAFFNQVINFVLADSYMQPHQHPAKEKIEEIWLMEGKMAVLFFDDQGKITQVVNLDPQLNNQIAIPAFAWHTYVTLSDHSISYETMNGVYDPATWKTFASWATTENTPESTTYLNQLKQAVVSL